MTIFICGLPRTGKSTVAKLIHNKLPQASLFVTEALRNALQKIDDTHAKDWGRKNSQLRQEVFPVFVKEMLVWNNKLLGAISVLDCALLSVQQVISIAEPNDIVVCLGFGGKTRDEIFDIIREYEQPTDYTATIDNEHLTKLWGNVADEDASNIKICANRDIKYFDTSANRDKVQQQIVQYVLTRVKDME